MTTHRGRVARSTTRLIRADRKAQPYRELPRLPDGPPLTERDLFAAYSIGVRPLVGRRLADKVEGEK